MPQQAPRRGRWREHSWLSSGRGCWACETTNQTERRPSCSPAPSLSDSSARRSPLLTGCDEIAEQLDPSSCTPGRVRTARAWAAWSAPNGARRTAKATTVVCAPTPRTTARVRCPTPSRTSRPSPTTPRCPGQRRLARGRRRRADRRVAGRQPAHLPRVDDPAARPAGRPLRDRLAPGHPGRAAVRLPHRGPRQRRERVAQRSLRGPVVPAAAQGW